MAWDLIVLVSLPVLILVGADIALLPKAAEVVIVTWLLSFRRSAPSKGGASIHTKVILHRTPIKTGALAAIIVSMTLAASDYTSI
jgi:hypothetical protein